MVKNLSHLSVDGGFSEWSAFGPCSVTCGIGTHQRERTCTNPPPSNGGDDCEGDYKEAAQCNAGGCPGKRLLRTLSSYVPECRARKHSGKILIGCWRAPQLGNLLGFKPVRIFLCFALKT